MVMDIVEDHFGKSLKIATKIPQVQKENFSSCCNSQHWINYHFGDDDDAIVIYIFHFFPGEKDCTLALNFGGGAETEDNVPARFVYSTSLYPSL